MTEIHCQLFGEEETTGWPRNFVAPENVQVEVMVVLEKIKIDTPDQTASIKWWLRQSWKDPRLAWDPETYRYGKEGRTGTVQQISRPAGRDGGVWIPDLTLWESNDQGTSVSNNYQSSTLQISHDGSVYWSNPQQVHIDMVPHMKLHKFPFDEQTVIFTLGSWSNAVSDQNTTFWSGETTKGDNFIVLMSWDNNNSLDAYSRKFDDEGESMEEWSIRGLSGKRFLDKYDCCPDSFVRLEGRIELRREPHFYLKFGVLPQILITALGFMCGALRGYTVEAASFIAGTGFTIVLALVAHGVFFVGFLPVLRQVSFIEVAFLFSLFSSIFGTCWTLYLLKKIENFEQRFHAKEQAEHLQEFLRRNACERQEVRVFFLLDQWFLPALWGLYVLGLMIAALAIGANLWTDLFTECLIIIFLTIVIICLSWYDMEKSTHIENRPHSDYIAYRRSKGRGGFGDRLTRLRSSFFRQVLKWRRKKELSSPADSRQDVRRTNNMAAPVQASVMETDPRMDMWPSHTHVNLVHGNLVQFSPTAGHTSNV